MNFFHTWPSWAWMWLLAVVTFGICKCLTWWTTPECRRGGLRLALYLFAWPGMDAAAFMTALAPAKPRLAQWLFALAKMLLGLTLLFAVARWVQELGADPYIVGWVGMIGIIMILHFGSFHLLACLFQSCGIDAQPIMDWPLLSVSVSEFWSKRWNLAFRDLTHRYLFRPLARRLGPRWALVVGFLWSGLIHDLVISVPAGGGYGRPTVYFIWQCLAIFIERGPVGHKLGLTNGWRGWFFTAAALFAPIWLLFHPPFVEGVILPFMQTLGALPS